MSTVVEPACVNCYNSYMGSRIGDLIKRERILRALSQAELAARAGLTAAAISQFETDSRDPNLESLEKLAKALEVTTDYLLGRKKYDESDAAENAQFKALFRKVGKLSDEAKKQLLNYAEYLEEKDVRERREGEGRGKK